MSSSSEYKPLLRSDECVGQVGHTREAVGLCEHPQGGEGRSGVHGSAAER